MPLELMPTRLERFVELRRSAWLSTSILWSTKDIPAMPSSQPQPPNTVPLEMDVDSKDLRNEIYSGVSRISSLNDDSSTEGDGGSGIKWRYATQGSQLHEASSRYRSDDAAFARKSYIDGVVYMLKGLPNDMDILELAAIRQAATTATTTPCQDHDHHQDNNNQIATLTTHHRHQQQHPLLLQQQSYLLSPNGNEKPLLHRTVQRLVAILVLATHLLFCLLKEGVRLGARWEREHNVSQVVVERGLVVAGALRARVADWSESPAGQAVGALGTWALGNVVAGVRDGLGEGVGRLVLSRGGMGGDTGGDGDIGGGKKRRL